MRLPFELHHLLLQRAFVKRKQENWPQRITSDNLSPGVRLLATQWQVPKQISANEHRRLAGRWSNVKIMFWISINVDVLLVLSLFVERAQRKWIDGTKYIQSISNAESLLFLMFEMKNLIKVIFIASNFGYCCLVDAFASLTITKYSVLVHRNDLFRREAIIIVLECTVLCAVFALKQSFIILMNENEQKKFKQWAGKWLKSEWKSFLPESGIWDPIRGFRWVAR